MDEPIVWYEGAGLTDRRFLHADERGSIVAISDGAGAVIGTNAYDEYGVPTSPTTGRFQYTGQAYISSLGLYYYRARFYHPLLGRFMQTDPIGYRGGMNLYAYVRNDPVNLVDPTGLNAGYREDFPPPDCTSECGQHIVITGTRDRSKEVGVDLGRIELALNMRDMSRSSERQTERGSGEDSEEDEGEEEEEEEEAEERDRENRRQCAILVAAVTGGITAALIADFEVAFAAMGPAAGRGARLGAARGGPGIVVGVVIGLIWGYATYQHDAEARIAQVCRNLG